MVIVGVSHDLVIVEPESYILLFGIHRRHYDDRFDVTEAGHVSIAFSHYGLAYVVFPPENGESAVCIYLTTKLEW